MEEKETLGSSKLCYICSSKLKDPYIKCSVCVEPHCLICRSCFSKGCESGNHLNDHSYEIVRKDFSLWGDNWTAAEELLLLEAIFDCGLGNWVGVSKHLKRSPQECEAHYWHRYVMCPKSPLPEFPVPIQSSHAIHPFPIPYKVSEMPPRPVLGSQAHSDMAGYSAVRGDFVTEYDNYFEMNLRDLDFDGEETDVELELKIAEVEIYNSQLRERAWRKKIIRDYGLIDLRQTATLFQNCADVLDQRVLHSLRPLMRLFPPTEFETFLESEHYEQELKRKIAVLKEYREAGLTRFGSIKFYQKLKRRRDKNSSSRFALQEVLTNLKNDCNHVQWLSRNLQDAGVNIPMTALSLPRKVAPPLDIIGLPGYEKINANERELCAQARLVPDAYLQFKDSLMKECHRHGSLKLAQARELIRIDVNKTRKIYNFLIKEGLIC